MRCAEFESRLNDLLDRRMRPDADALLCTHARKCESCGERLFAQELLFEGLSAQPRPEPSADLTENILAALRFDTVGTENNKGTLVSPARGFGYEFTAGRIAWAAAVAVVLAVGVGLYFNSLSGQVSPAASGPTQIAQLIPSNGSVSTSRPVSVSISINPLDQPEYLDRMRASISDVPNWVGEVTTGLRPLTDSMEAALDALRSSVPNFRNAG